MIKKKWMNGWKKIDHNEAVKEGHEQGLKQGLEQGSNNKALEIALNMLKSGMKVSDISKFTGLDEAEISKLKFEKN